MIVSHPIKDSKMILQLSNRKRNKMRVPKNATREIKVDKMTIQHQI